MSKFTLEEYENIRKEEKEYARKQNDGLGFIEATDEDKKTIYLITTIYRFEYPKNLSRQRIINIFNSLYKFMREHENNDLFSVLGLSCHKHWTPYVKVSGKKGGRKKKIFNAMPYYKERLHIHFYIMGKSARSLAERIYKNQSRYIKLKPFKDTVRVQHYFQPHYAEWQSSKYREFGGDLSQFIDDK